MKKPALVRRVVATRHVASRDGLQVERVLLDVAPVAVVSEVDSLFGGWWRRAGGYAPGRDFGTRMG